MPVRKSKSPAPRSRAKSPSKNSSPESRAIIRAKANAEVRSRSKSPSAKTTTKTSSPRKRSPSAKSMPELKSIFTRLDENANEVVDMNEIHQAMTECGMPVTKQQLVSMMNEADENDDGEISFDEFVNIMDKAADWEASTYWNKAFTAFVNNLTLVRDVSPRPSAQAPIPIIINNNNNINNSNKNEAVACPVVATPTVVIDGRHPPLSAADIRKKKAMIEEALRRPYYSTDAKVKKGFVEMSYEALPSDPSMKIMDLLYDTDKRYYQQRWRNVMACVYIFCTSCIIGFLLEIKFRFEGYGDRVFMYWFGVGIMCSIGFLLLSFLRNVGTYRVHDRVVQDYLYFLNLSNVPADATDLDYRQDPFVEDRLKHRNAGGHVKRSATPASTNEGWLVLWLVVMIVEFVLSNFKTFTMIGAVAMFYCAHFSWSGVGWFELLVMYIVAGVGSLTLFASKQRELSVLRSDFNRKVGKNAPFAMIFSFLFLNMINMFGFIIWGILTLILVLGIEQEV